MRLPRLALRATSIVVVSLMFALVGLLHWAATRLGGAGLATRQGLIGRYLAAYCRLLGATFVKAGQVLSTRPDLASEPLRRALSGLQDRVGPFRYDKVRQAFLEEFGATPETLFAELEPYPVASASMAQVHRGTLPDGQQVAVKVLRPGIDRLVRCDLALMRMWAVPLGWIPALRPLSPRAAVQHLAAAIWEQVDLRREADNNRVFRQNFAGQPGVCFPQLVDRLCGRRVLCMSFIEGRPILSEDWGEERSRQLVQSGFRAVLKMVFIDGFVHADLHPGNILVTDTEIALVDLGLVANLSARHRQGLVQVLFGWGSGDCALVCRGIAELGFYGQEPANPAQLQEDIEQMLERYHNIALAELQVGQLLHDLIRMIRQQWSRLDPALSMIALAIGVIEGVGKQLAPDLRLVQEALPYLHQVASDRSARVEA